MTLEWNLRTSCYLIFMLFQWLYLTRAKCNTVVWDSLCWSEYVMSFLIASHFKLKTNGIRKYLLSFIKKVKNRRLQSFQNTHCNALKYNTNRIRERVKFSWKVIVWSLSIVFQVSISLLKISLAKKVQQLILYTAFLAPSAQKSNIGKV